MKKTLNPKYLDMKYPTPEIFTNKHEGSRVLIIGTGASTKRILPYKHLLKEKFDVIIGVNFSIKEFEKEMDYHVVGEKTPTKLFIIDNFRKDLPRIFNWKTILKYPKDMNFVKMTRNYFNTGVNIRSYKAEKTEGLFIGPIASDNLSLGTVMLQAIHLAGIIGCKDLYLVGADYVFTKDLDHYYNDKLYRDTKKDWGTPIITVEYNGEKRSTLRYFKESAAYINKVINYTLKPASINVYSFSDGLITNAECVDVDKFFG